MRFGFHILFAAFYLLSSYATNQDRIGYIVDGLQHSAARPDDVSTGQAGKDRIHYTHFREAKKVDVGLNFNSALTLRFCTPVSFREFHPQVFAFKSQFALEISHSRAPPSRI